MKRRSALVAWLIVISWGAVSSSLGAGCNSTSPPTPPPEAQTAKHAAAASAAAPGTPAVDVPDPDPREDVLAHGVARVLMSEHLLGKPINDELSREAFPEYLEHLDPSKSYLLKEQVKQLSVYADKMDDELRDGQLVLGRLGAAMLTEREKVIAKVVAAQLAKPFDYSKKETLETDPEKLDFAATEDELADRWRRMLKLQVLQRVAQMEDIAEAAAKSKAEKKKKKGKGGDEDADKKAEESLAKTLAEIPPTFEGKEKKARAELAKSYAGRFSRLEKTEPLEPAETFINAIAAVYDPHTLYLAPVEKENFDIQMSGSLEGIGAVLTEDDHYIKVSELVPGGAAWRQGKLGAGDLILAVAQEGKDPVDVADMRINQVVQMIRGPKGTVVALTVKKPDDRVEHIAITRDVVEIESAFARGAVIDLPGQKPMGLIYLPSFYGNTRSHPGQTVQREAAADVRKLLAELRKRNVGGVVLDLRGNGGGLLDQARDITGLFIKTGPVVQTRYSNQPIQILADSNPSIAFKGQVVVLVDRFSASASEIVAGALQDYGRAVVVGTTTHGKGTVQALLDLSRLSPSTTKPLGVIKLTIQQFFRISGDSTQWRGVVPDVELPDRAAHIESGERYLDHAIPWSKVKPVPYQKPGPYGWTVPALAAASKARVASRPVFARLQRRTAYAKERREKTVVPLELEAWRAQREKDEKALEENALDLDQGPPRLEVTLLGAKKNERIKAWGKSVARDPWLEESVHILDDMVAAKPH